LDANLEAVDVHAMYGTFVLVAVFGAHEKVASGNVRELREQIGRHRSSRE
jgi:hypothetical protein